jgi:hypothetical protein
MTYLIQLGAFAIVLFLIWTASDTARDGVRSFINGKQEEMPSWPEVILACACFLGAVGWMRLTGL